MRIGAKVGLTATAGNVSTPSGLFNITGGKLVFDVAPSDGVENTPINPAVKVSLRDGQNNVITSDSSSTVTLSVFGNSASNKISGNTATFVAGVAVFPNLKFGSTGFYKLQATDSNNDVDMVSSRFKISGDHLVFLTQPKSGDVNTPLPLKVAIEDKQNKIDTNATSSIGLSLNVEKGGNNAVLGGTITLAFVNGVTAFTGSDAPSINVIGTYSITATEEDDSTGVLAPTTTTTPITSKSFTMGGFHLVVKAQPAAEVDPMAPIPMSVQIVDAHGKPYLLENTAQVELSLNPVDPDNNATLGGASMATFHDGRATFPESAGAFVIGAGKFTLTAAEVGVDDPAAPVDTRTFTVLGYKLKMVTPNGPFVADFPDVMGSTGTNVIFAVFDAHGKPIESPDQLPDTQVTATALDGSGEFTGLASTSTANGFFSDSYRTRNETLPLDQGTNQANYPYTFFFSETGRYQIKISPVPSSTSSITSQLIVPLTFDCVVGNPLVCASQVIGVHVNETDNISVNICKTKNDDFPFGFFNVLGASYAGVSLSVVGAGADAISGQTTQSFTPETYNVTETDGTMFQYEADTAILHVMFSKPGEYTVAVQELISPNQMPFDPANASPVTTTIPALITVHVLPEKVEFIQQPPATVPSGQAFSASAAIEDLAGNIITDVGSTEDLQFFAVLTAVGFNGSPITLNSNVPFVGGVATFSNLSIMPKGPYRLRVTVFSNAEGGIVDPEALMGQSKIFTISTAG